MQLKKHIRRQSRASRIAAIRDWLNTHPDDQSAITALEKLNGNQPEAHEDDEY
jgi:hypothetical protein